MVIRSRPARSTGGCLVRLVLLALAVYVLGTLGVVYLHAYEFQDDISQQADFASRNSNQAILATLSAQADSLGLAIDPSQIGVRRTRRGITIGCDYTQTVHLFGHSRDIAFSPHAERTF